jgi:hypothetical protein
VAAALACGLKMHRDAERRRTPAGLRLESESGMGREKALIGGTIPSAGERERRGRRRAARGELGRGKKELTGPRAGGERRKENGLCGGAGLHSEERKEEGAGPAGLGCKGEKEKKKKKREWAGPN